jgi:hypothetical protein
MSFMAGTSPAPLYRTLRALAAKAIINAPEARFWGSGNYRTKLTFHSDGTYVSVPSATIDIAQAGFCPLRIFGDSWWKRIAAEDLVSKGLM